MLMEIVEPKLNVVKTNSSNTNTTFEISGLGAGMASGYASALRTVLYEHIPGCKVIGYKLLGVKNSMEVLSQYTQPIREISYAVERALVKNLDTSNKLMQLTYEGEVDGDLFLGDFKGEDIEILNPDLKILTTSQKQQVSMELVVALGVGYLREDEELPASLRGSWEQGLIRVDTDFNPVTFVNFKTTENLPVEGKDTLYITIETNGTAKTKSALSIASTILMSYLNPLSKVYSMEWDSIDQESVVREEVSELDTPIEELTLTPDTYNVLKRDGARALRDLKGADVRYKPEMVSQIIRSLEEIGFTDIELLSRK